MSAETGTTDLFIIGGGINGCGIARDAAGRGLSVTLAEKGDLARATSSASTKLFHGGCATWNISSSAWCARRWPSGDAVGGDAAYQLAAALRAALRPRDALRGDTPTSRLLGTVMPWTRGRRPAWSASGSSSTTRSAGGSSCRRRARSTSPPIRRGGRCGRSSGAPGKSPTAGSRICAWSRSAARDRVPRAGRGSRCAPRCGGAARRRWLEGDDRRAGCRTEHRARALVNAGAPGSGPCSATSSGPGPGARAVRSGWCAAAISSRGGSMTTTAAISSRGPTGASSSRSPTSRTSP